MWIRRRELLASLPVDDDKGEMRELLIGGMADGEDVDNLWRVFLKEMGSGWETKSI